MSTNSQRFIIRFGLLFLALVLGGCGSNRPKPNVAPDLDSQHTSKTMTEFEQRLYTDASSALIEGDYKYARRSFEKLFNQHTGHQGIRLNFATALYHEGNFSESLKILAPLERTDASRSAMYNLIGLIKVAQKQFTQAKKAYRTAITADNPIPQAYYNLALLYDIYFQNVEKAYDMYKVYLKLAPEDTETRQWVEQLQYSLNQD